VLAGPDPRDPLCASSPAPAIVPLLDQGPPRPPRLGRLRGLFEERASGAVLQMMDETLEVLAAAGAPVSEAPLPPSFAEVIPRHRTVMACEAAAWHEQRLAEHPDDYLPRIRELLSEGLATSAVEYIRARQHQALLRREILGSLTGVDVLICPATPADAPDHSTTGDPVFNSPWSYTGLPTVSFPVALSPDGLPLAVQLVGRPFTEPALFAAALWCEEAIQRSRIVV
jgi:aspartyl-tRNA(Asn)/glutamyl-tRNA(Gln) amidotransferase subunit A